MEKTISLEEAKALYAEAEAFSAGGTVSADSPFRAKSEEIFHGSYVSHMMFLAGMIFRTLAAEYMDII